MRGRAAGLALLLTGCVYFNGIYNARQAAEAGDALRRRGRDAAAADSFVVAATKAESVLVRHPRSDWRTEALYLAGRGWALAGDCARARPRLDELLRRPDLDAERRERATLALGICEVRDGRATEARALLDPLSGSRVDGVARESALWSARAAAAAGEMDDAARLLRGVGPEVAEWELARAWLDAGRPAAAESLLASRAAAGDWRPEAAEHLTRLWRAGREDGALRIAELYDRRGVAAGARARMQAAAARLLLAAGRDSAARQRLEAAARAAPDSAVGREAALRLAALDVAASPTLSALAGAAERALASAPESPEARRLADNALLVRMLAGAADGSGASLFLAAEVARDSLRAVALADALFRQVATAHSGSSLAPRALLAAAAMRPDSAEGYARRARADYPSSPYVRAHDGGSLGAGAVVDDRLLEEAWQRAARALADTLLVLRPPAAPPAGIDSAAAPTPTPP